jgi:hypothetical protein
LCFRLLEHYFLLYIFLILKVSYHSYLNYHTLSSILVMFILECKLQKSNKKTMLYVLLTYNIRFHNILILCSEEDLMQKPIPLAMNHKLIFDSEHLKASGNWMIIWQLAKSVTRKIIYVESIITYEKHLRSCAKHIHLQKTMLLLCCNTWNLWTDITDMCLIYDYLGIWFHRSVKLWDGHSVDYMKVLGSSKLYSFSMTGQMQG